MTFSGRRVLIVEDEFLVSLATTDLLESIGCEIVGPAASLATAVQLAQLEALDAAVLDINIAGELIWPAAAELQHRRVPLSVCLSAYTADDSPCTFRRCSASGQTFGTESLA